MLKSASTPVRAAHRNRGVLADFATDSRQNRRMHASEVHPATGSTRLRSNQRRAKAPDTDHPFAFTNSACASDFRAIVFGRSALFRFAAIADSIALANSLRLSSMGKTKYAAFPSPITYCGGSHVRTSELGSEILPLWFGLSSI